MSEQTAKLYTGDAGDPQIEAVRDFLCGYQLCMDMLQLRRYERKRAYVFCDPCSCEEILAGNEGYWRARMHEVERLLNAMRNGREKLVLYYHYVRGQSIEHAADMIGVSRRTGYRLHRKGLLFASFLFKKMKKSGEIPLLIE